MSTNRQRAGGPAVIAVVIVIVLGLMCCGGGIIGILFPLVTISSSDPIVIMPAPPPGSSAEPNRPPEIAGIWQWQWAGAEGVHHLVLHENGQAERLLGGETVADSGTWQVAHDGNLQLRFDNEELSADFQMDGNSRLLDIATIPTDRDFPWIKVDKISTKLGE